MQTFTTALTEKGLSPVEVSLRWLVHHSPLAEEDRIILGASREEQIVKSAENIKKGKLDEAVLEDVQRLWESVEELRIAKIWGNDM